MLNANYVLDPKLDLSFELESELSPELIWKAWTTPSLLTEWFCPKPWKTTHAEIDLRPGGKFHTIMRGPEGQEFPNTGCYLIVETNRALVWTDSLVANYRPSGTGMMTAGIFLTPTTINGKPGTKYKAIVLHNSEDSRAKHEAMNFREGWSKAFAQLVELMGK